MCNCDRDAIDYYYLQKGDRIQEGDMHKLIGNHEWSETSRAGGIYEGSSSSPFVYRRKIPKEQCNIKELEKRIAALETKKDTENKGNYTTRDKIHAVLIYLLYDITIRKNNYIPIKIWHELIEIRKELNGLYTEYTLDNAEKVYKIMEMIQNI